MFVQLGSIPCAHFSILAGLGRKFDISLTKQLISRPTCPSPAAKLDED